MKRPDLIIHLVNSAHGVYVPQVFAGMAECSEWVIDPDDLAIITAGPDYPDYREAWESILNNAHIQVGGFKYTLHQDGDLWAIRDPKNRAERAEYKRFFGETFA